MKQGRTPDRVHVVHPPQNDFRGDVQPAAPLSPAPQNTRAMEIVRTLAQISDKLKRSEAERYELLAELREYRKSINQLEDKAEKSERAYLDLENKIKSRNAEEAELVQRQAKFERALKETENKLVQASAGQNLLDQRIKNTEDFQTSITTRIDETITQQARLDRQMEKIGQDKSRMMRKVERMEEILTETQDTLKARALVLLTDQSAAAQGGWPQIAAYSADEAQNDNTPWWRKSLRIQSAGMASMVLAALLFGWTINQVQQPEMPKIAVLQNGGVAKLDMDKQRWEILPEGTNTSNATAVSDDTLTPIQMSTDDSTPVQTTQTPESNTSNDVLNKSDEELMAALEEDPDKLAAQLNDIAPEAKKDLEEATTLPKEIATATGFSPLSKLGNKPFAQDPKIAALVAKEIPNKALGTRMQKDASLPQAVQNLEQQAFAGVPEAQHDLAAIYTAGRGGVTQNFEKAAFWFREAAQSNIANADYNLGVLYHQGLGVEKDLDRALYWYREAAKLGHAEAQYNLGIAHIEGIGTKYDAPLAAAFFESSANQGVIEAAYNLGLIYENGLISDAQKSQEALMWYKIAADGGSTDAKAALNQLASAMNIQKSDIDKIVEKMQLNYAATHGRKAGA